MKFLDILKWTMKLFDQIFGEVCLMVATVKVVKVRFVIKALDA